MPEEVPMERVYEALDLMVEAKWISEYARDSKNTAIKWTEDGKKLIAAIYMAVQELGPEKLNFELWWAVALISHLRFRPGGGGQP